MKNPTMIYKAPGLHEIHGGRFDYRIVDADEEGELEQAVADGWHLTTPAALEAGESAKKAAEDEDNAPPTRDELIAKAKELDLSFGPNTSSKKLGEMIDAKLKADADAKALEDAAALALQQAGG